MKLSKLLQLAVLSLLLVGGVARAEAPAKGYTSIATPQSVQTPGKTEVVEVFWYRCGHCFAFDPSLEEWVKRLPKDVTFRRVPVMWEDSRIPDAKLYYTLESMGLLEKLHTKVFNAIHNEALMVQNQEKLFDWVASQGVDRKSFADTYNSFSTVTKVSRARELTRGYGITGVPAMVVDGKYLITNTSAGGSNEAMLNVADRLISEKSTRSSGEEPAAKVADTSDAKPVATKTKTAKKKHKAVQQIATQ